MIYMKSLSAQITTALRLKARQLVLPMPHRSSTPSPVQRQTSHNHASGMDQPRGRRVCLRLVDPPLVNMRMITIRRPILSGGTWKARGVGRVPSAIPSQPCELHIFFRVGLRVEDTQTHACLVAPISSLFQASRAMRPRLAVKQGPMTAVFCRTLPKACGLQSVRLRETRYRRTALRRLSDCWPPRRQCLSPTRPTGVTGGNQDVCGSHDDCYHSLYLIPGRSSRCARRCLWGPSFPYSNI
ncbi:hypothetical protein EDB92DRAFT_406817 [Lactarius akahatsu]|uniref:Uncharacterized protein n=1 Tax=Lactarius akahatsu TaxID=416441 RepID=A0AAD4LND3_9AGAM|nr:hypothetical protein EDB92DRAFT_406817 [Lactarius akahatsu]